MILNAEFKEVNHTISAKLDEVKVIGAYDIGYEDGYHSGYDAGNEVGYDIGYNDGHYDGYKLGEVDGWVDGNASGVAEGESRGYANGYAEGVEHGIEQGKQEAIDRYCPEFTESGAVVTCNPVENYPLGVVSNITPIQAGSGDPTPSNVRPITAHTSATVTRCGENMLDINRLLEATGWAVDENGVYYGNTQALYRKFRHDTTDGFLKGCFKTNTRYTIMLEAKNSLATAEATKTTIMPWVKYTDGSSDGFGNKTYNYTVTTFVTAANKTVEKIGVTYSSIGTDYIKQFTVCEGEVATTEPYRANNYTAEFGQNVYAGNFDWSTGVLTLTHECVTFTGKENSWVQYSDSAIVNYTFFTNSESAYYLGGWSSHSDPKKDDVSMRIINAGGGVRVGNMTTFWGLADNTVETWKSYLQAQVAAGTSVQVVNKLKTPITVQLTPQEILSLGGVNTVQSDTGDTTVTFKADPIALVAQLEESIISLGGEI